MQISDITASTAAAQDAQRTIAVMAKTLRIEREQADATIALIQEAAPAPTGRIIDVRA
jgi:hypothetical protein